MLLMMQELEIKLEKLKTKRGSRNVQIFVHSMAFI